MYIMTATLQTEKKIIKMHMVGNGSLLLFALLA